MKSRWILIALIIVASVIVLSLYPSKQDCCLCDSFRYHAPCLIDLETGDILELALYDPHAIKTAELAENQTQVDTFSFIKFGDIAGTKLTGNRTIEIKVPTSDDARSVVLCKSCRKRLPNDYSGRYILADLYAAEYKELIPIVDSVETQLRCYTILMEENLEKEIIVVTIQGTLDIYR